MSVMTLQGVIENGQIRLADDVHLPEKTTVYVVVPGIEIPPTVHLRSPRLVHSEQIADFCKQVEEIRDAGVCLRSSTTIGYFLCPRW